MKLRTAAGYHQLTGEKKEAICNGAGAADDWRSAFIPNTLYGLDCTEVFNIHDYAYYIGSRLADKELADAQMFVNLIMLIREGTFLLRWVRYLRAITYYTVVDQFGLSAFNRV